MRDYLKNISLHCNGDIKKMYYYFNNRKSVLDYSCKDNFITIYDLEYPDYFKYLQYPPLVLFYKGNINLLRTTCISVVGSRDASLYACSKTFEYTKRLASKYTIVSGMALGIDYYAHRGAITNNGKSIGILGCGLDQIYPLRNRFLFEDMFKNHLVISEYPSGIKPLKWHFPVRNRLIVALSDSLLIMSCQCKSGTMHSANLASDLNKDIFCLPLRIDDFGSNGIFDLVNDGAYLLTEELINNLLGVY